MQPIGASYQSPIEKSVFNGTKPVAILGSTIEILNPTAPPNRNGQSFSTQTRLSTPAIFDLLYFGGVDTAGADAAVFLTWTGSVSAAAGLSGRFYLQ